MRLVMRQRRRRRNIFLGVILGVVILIAILVFNQFIIPSARKNADTEKTDARRTADK
jgi:hypothetical protein